ncbi:MAG: hypothetical protein LC768_01215, partial [Acidobacteria bacterium]|nr:hypothetical protein [Acidobacteriota bacterium]
MDEAQAWLLAKDSSVIDLFVKYLRYEGSPGLWHLILMLPAKLGLSYFTINIFSAVFSALGVWLFLRYSPFPPVIKILFPFSYFVFFQYGVVARSYCLIPPLLFLIAIKYKTKIKHPYQYILLLCLLANVSTHTFLIAAAILFVHLLDVGKMWNQLDKQSKINQALAVSIFGLMAGLLVLVLLPPSDHFVVGHTNWNLGNFIEIGKVMISGALVSDESSKVFWLQKVMSLAIFGVSLLWLRQKKLTFLYLLPLFLILCLFAVKYWNFWHQGILFFLWVFVLWVSFDKDRNKELSKMGKTLLLLVSIVLAVQVYWSTYTVRFDFYNNYSGSYKIAEYIKA